MGKVTPFLLSGSNKSRLELSTIELEGDSPSIICNFSRICETNAFDGRTRCRLM